jgi:hypothetical protein
MPAVAADISGPREGRSIMRITLLTSALVCAAIAASTPGHADVINLGTQSAPASVSFGNSWLSGAFLDSFKFSIGPSNTFLVSSFLTTGFSNRAFINDMQASLFRDAALIEAGTATSLSNPFPAREVSLAPVLLAAGDYRIDVFGTATSVFPGPTSAYGGTLTVAAAAQVPEPGTAVLLTGGLMVLAAVSFRSGVRSWPAQERES